MTPAFLRRRLLVVDSPPCPGFACGRVPQAGHASNQDNPEAFTALLLEQLERVLPVSA